MDTSTQYKNMCNKAEEIQRKWKPKIGDFWGCNCSSCLDEKDPVKQTYSDSVGRAWIIQQGDWIAYQNLPLDRFYRDDQQAAITSKDCGFGAYWRDYKEGRRGERGFVWLPRLDQLFDFFLGKNLSPREIMSDFHNFLLGSYAIKFNSLEQISLAFLENKLYNKRWNFKEGKWE